VVEPAGDDAITVPAAAALLGLTPHALYELIAEGQLGRMETYGVTVTGRPRRRRTFHLTRQDVDDFLERARIRQGELANLYAPLRRGKYQ
jgi:hypothetical protein